MNSNEYLPALFRMIIESAAAQQSLLSKTPSPSWSRQQPFSTTEVTEDPAAIEAMRTAAAYDRISAKLRQGLGVAGAVTNVVAPHEIERLAFKLGPFGEAIPRQADIEIPESWQLAPKGTRVRIGQPLRGGEGRGVLLRFPI